jgi:hypothetical protein
VDAGAIGRIDLDLPAPRRAIGQVVDAVSGESISTARLSALIITGGEILKPWKTTQEVKEGGVFEFAGLATVEGMLEISAAGWATREVSVSPGREPRVDLGRIALDRVQSLVVRVHTTAAADLSVYGLSLKSVTNYLPGVRFPADGVLQLDGLAPGIAQLVLESSNGTAESRSVRIHPGGNNSCDFYLDGQPLDVEVVPPNGSRLQDKSSLGITFVDRHGEQRTRTCAIAASGEAHPGRIDTDRVLLEVFAEDGTTLALREFEVPSSGPRTLVFEMNARPVRLRVVDDGHHPVVGADVHVTSHRGAIEWKTTATTNEVGEALIPEVGGGEILVGACHVEHAPIPCSPLSTADVVGGALEIVMRRGSPSEIYLRDANDALSGVHVELMDPCSSIMPIGQMLAAEDGRILIPKLTPGDYRVLVDHPGIWRTEQPISVTPTSTSFTVQLRRLGSARIRVRSGVGNPVEGTSIDLIDVTTGARVADWIQAGEVPGPAAGLRTDANGTLVIHGLPRGSYRCLLTTASGDTMERTLDVPPQATGELEVVTP